MNCGLTMDPVIVFTLVFFATALLSCSAAELKERNNAISQGLKCTGMNFWTVRRKNYNES